MTWARIHYGGERVLVMLRWEGWRDNHKRVHRIYKEEACLCGKPVAQQSEQSAPQPIKMATAPYALLGMDSVSDALFRWTSFPVATGAGSIHARVPGDRCGSDSLAPKIAKALPTIPLLLAVGQLDRQVQW